MYFCLFHIFVVLHLVSRQIIALRDNVLMGTLSHGAIIRIPYDAYNMACYCMKMLNFLLLKGSQCILRGTCHNQNYYLVVECSLHVLD